MKLIYLLLLFPLLFACQEKKQTQIQTEVAAEKVTFTLDSNLIASYPSNWQLKEHLQEGTHEMAVWKPQKTTQSGVFIITLSQNIMTEDMILRVIKSDVYENLGIQDSSFQESEMAEITYKGTKAIEQHYQTNTDSGEVEGQFIVFNKQEKSYIIYRQGKTKDKLVNQKAFQLFDDHLKIP